GRISYLKRRYGLDRTLFDGLTGARTWCGLGVLTHNSVKIAHLVEARRSAGASRPTRRGATATAGTAQTNAPTPGRSGQTATSPLSPPDPARPDWPSHGRAPVREPEGLESGESGPPSDPSRNSSLGADYGLKAFFGAK
ncbi:MAG TPA: hypothetical protein VEF72_15795, partial [Mycobacterium sp.]|nr:hypothetical protein [Mycobacterium sp.]